MGTTADKLQNIVDTKASIKTAIENKGVTVGDIPFAQYPSKITEIDTVRSSFNFTNTYYEAPDERLNITGTRTFVVTFKTGASLQTTTCCIFSQSPSNTGMRLVALNGTILQGYIGQNGFTYTGGTLQPNTLYLVILEYNEVTGNLRGILNGAVTDTVNYPSPADDPTLFTLGNRGGTDYYFKYDVYNFHIFNYALSASEINSIWNNGQPDKWVMPDTWSIPSPSNNYKSDFSTDVNGWNVSTALGGSIAYGNNSVLVNLPSSSSDMQIYKYFVTATQLPCHIYVEIVTNDTTNVTSINALPFNSSRGVSLTSLNRGDGTILWYGTVLLQSYASYSYLNIAGAAGTTFTIYSIEFTSVGCVAEYLPPYLYSDKWIDTSLQNNYLVKHVSSQSGGAN